MSAQWSDAALKVGIALAAPLLLKWLERFGMPSDAVADTKCIALATFDNHYVRANPHDGRILFTDRLGDSEKFKVAKPKKPNAIRPSRRLRYGSRIALFAKSPERFVAADREHDWKLGARVRWADPAQGAVFTIVGENGGVFWPPLGLRYGDRFALRAANKKLVSFKNGSEGELVATAVNKPTQWEVFSFLSP